MEAGKNIEIPIYEPRSRQILLLRTATRTGRPHAESLRHGVAGQPGGGTEGGLK